MDFSFLLNLFKMKNACEASNIQFINLIVKSAYLNFVGNIPKSHFTPPATKITWRKISIPIEMVIYIYIYICFGSWIWYTIQPINNGILNIKMYT